MMDDVKAQQPASGFVNRGEITISDAGMQRGINWREFKVIQSGRQIGWIRVEQNPRTCKFSVTMSLSGGPIRVISQGVVSQQNAIEHALRAARLATGGVV